MFVPWSQWKEFYCGTSMDTAISLKQELERRGVAFRYECTKHEETPPLRGFARNALGRVGEVADHAVIHYIYVKQADYKSLYDLRP